MKYEWLEDIVRDLVEKVYGAEDPVRQAALAFLDPEADERAKADAADAVTAAEDALEEAKANAKAAGADSAAAVKEAKAAAA